MEKMLSPQELNDLRYSNALEEFVYYDTCLVNYLQDSDPQFAKYAQAGFFQSYSDMGLAGELPFFKLRNRANVGLPYCNMDTRDRFDLPFHVFAIGVQFVGPVAGSGGDPNVQATGAYFAGELPKHCALTLKVGQDEKLVSFAQFIQAGAGNAGAYNQLSSTVVSGTVLTQNIANGRPNRWNLYPLDPSAPIQIPRNESVEVTIRFSNYGRSLLQAMGSIGDVLTRTFPTTGLAQQSALIRVALYGVREVQLRNLQHY